MGKSFVGILFLEKRDNCMDKLAGCYVSIELMGGLTIMGKKKIVKIASATIMAATTIVAVAPAPSDAATSLNSKIKTAKAAIKKPFDTYFYTSKLASVSTVEKQIKSAKQAKKDINSTIKKSMLSKKEKDAKYKEIEAYDKYITRSEGYVKGYKAAEKAKAAHGKSIGTLTNAIVAKKSIDIRNQYEALDKAVKKADKNIKDTVYGAKIEKLLYDKFTKSTKTALNGDLKVPYYYEKADYWVKKGDLKTADKRMHTVSSQLKKVSKTSKLGKAIHAYVKEVKGKYDDAVYAEKKKEVAKRVNAYVALANGELKTKEQINAAKKAKAAINLNGIKEADRKEFLEKMALADKKVAAAEEALKNPAKAITLSLMHTNDTHAHLDNVAKRVTAVKEVRKSKPQALLVDAGDVFSGTLYFNEFKGQADLRFMNLMKYDVMTFGNHEFDLGSSAEGHQALADFIKGAQFPIVSSNVDFSKDDKFKGLFSDLISSKPEQGKIYNGIVKEVDGQKVGFFGLTTEETKDISSPGSIEFENYLEEAEKAVKAFKGMGVNKIVAVSHIGYDDNAAYDNDLTLAAKVKGIDVIVGGHSHTQLDAPVVIDKDDKGKAKEPTVIVQGYQYSDYLGTIDVEFDKQGKIVGQAGKLIKLSEKQDDAEAAKVLETYSSKIKELKETKTGATAVKALETPRDAGDETKPSVRKNETELGNLITDGMLSKAKEFNKDTVIAFQNGGGIRAGIDQGEITLGEILTVLPFGNTLATMKLTGAEIIEALEHSVSLAPKENGGFLHVSGMKFSYDSSKEAGNRVTKAEVLGQDGTYSELDAAKEYVVATNAFTAKGGDGFTVFKKAYEEGRVTDIGLADWENLRDYVSGLKTVDPSIEGRIKDVAGSNTDPTVVLAKDFGGTADAPKAHEGDVVVDITDISSLENAVVKGNLTLTGTPPDNFTFSQVTVEGNLDLSGLNGKTVSMSGVTVNGETIL
ncbi:MULTISPECIES: bifunctional metallophosphatase/5'-nucleotidase [Peribacillus]|uniref:bifunctional metallophosphatase/5'-nucleotidase n=1 Tax=Peribacillus TaxID=2675229 RepID=UPI001F4E8D5B|nr:MULTISPECIES: 5'-nucleotidase C-terminal domain-containing protein [unclassified Peribacillus]MCK1985632.1 5'-nucleotidase C-terminal domain-containing protein [Peribacillus sp. Aquil_B1]MCK2009352.1 5'-nucleotidase C-terminal domain-containing protein [Peribacillus sp. Aquil_B8]